MKKLSLLLLTLTVCFFTACHKDIWAELENLDQRVTKLEELCKEMNTNITSLQTIVDVLQSNDFITSIVEIKKDGKVVGYTITFGKHDPITIYHGQNGKDGQNGQNGADGKDGITPVIGVAQDTDGVYYWTLNGEWLLDDNGNKLPVSGKDGQNGADGTMPQLKIEEGYWYVSYDNGVTWTQLGKATGEDGQNGDKGDKGDTGDSMFQSVTQDANYVYFTLADGTVIKIAKKTTNTNPSNGFYNNREYIDLGLPSGTKWAKENMDGYYCFGGTSSNVLISDTIFINGKALTEGDSICGTVYDVATLEWGYGWQIPTANDFQELIDYCTVSYLSEEGMRLQSNINGKFIYFIFDKRPSGSNYSHSSGTYTWFAKYLSATAYSMFYISMSREYYSHWIGYKEMSKYQIEEYELNNEINCLIRPVCKF